MFWCTFFRFTWWPFSFHVFDILIPLLCFWHTLFSLYVFDILCFLFMFWHTLFSLFRWVISFIHKGKWFYSIIIVILKFSPDVYELDEWKLYHNCLHTCHTTTGHVMRRWRCTWKYAYNFVSVCFILVMSVILNRFILFMHQIVQDYWRWDSSLNLVFVISSNHPLAYYTISVAKYITGPIRIMYCWRTTCIAYHMTKT